MRFGDSFWSRAALIAATVVLPIKAGGCGGSSACVTFTQAAYDANGGACPGKGTPGLFTNNTCGQGDFAQIESVNSEGSFDGEFCCYAVTEAPAGTLIDCAGTGGFSTGGGGVSGVGGTGNPGGFGDTTTSTGFGGSTTVGPTTAVSGTGGTGGTGGTCASCNDELDGASTDPAQLCAQAAMFWSALGTCLCGGGPCMGACSTTACTGQPASPACTSCMNDPSASGCGAQLAGCKSN